MSAATGQGIRRSATVIAGAAALCLAVAMGIGRFAFTPLLPFMLRDGTIDLPAGSTLATANYLGYLAGALGCTMLPRQWPQPALLRTGLVATAVLTAAMAWQQPLLWPAIRFLTGAVSAVVFVLTAGWTLERLAERGQASLGGLIFTGPGAGIALSGVVAAALSVFGGSGATGWLAFAALAALLTALVWPVFDDAPPRRPTERGPEAPARAPPPTARRTEMALFAVAYLCAGFGYIVTATFLPVIAAVALPGSGWLTVFWPVLGLAAVGGCLLAIRAPPRLDRRWLLVGAYLMQAVGVVFALLVPSVIGFAIGSVLVGLPFTAITYWAMAEARRLRPDHPARAMGLLTALYGLGQIAGPPVVAGVLAGAPDRLTGFARSLETASAALVIGATLFAILIQRRAPD